MLLKKLVEIESPSGREEKIREFVYNYLTDLGYDVIEGKYYLAVNKSDLIVATHLDTVNIKRKFEFDGVYAYGTGVCDAKAGVCAMLEAAEKGIDYTLAFFCDEEEGGKGSRDFVENWRYGKFAIVLEPTDLKIASKHYGSLECVLIVKGLEAHGATPEFGINAIEKAFEFIREFKDFRITPLKIVGGSDEYVIPNSCELRFDIVFPPEIKLEDIKKTVEVVAKKYGDLKIVDESEGYVSGNVVKFLEEAIKSCGLKVEHTVMKSWTDAMNLKSRFDVVVWGAGELHLCHTKFERIKIEDIKKVRDVLIKLNEIYNLHDF